MHTIRIHGILSSMRLRHGLSIFAIVLSISLLGYCGSESFNTNFPPPGTGIKIGEIYPKQVRGIEPEFSYLKFSDVRSTFGHKAVYGDIAEIQSIQTAPNGSLDSIFKENIIDSYFSEDFQTKASGNYDGAWVARGTKSDGKRFYAWSHENWIYFIQAKDDEIFEEIVREFPYIESK